MWARIFDTVLAFLALCILMLLGFLMSVYSGYFIIPLIAFACYLGFRALSLKCPSCGKSVLNNPIKLFGTEIYIITSHVPDKCTRCGTDLDNYI